MAFKPPKYEELSDEEFQNKYEKICGEWQNFLDVEGIQAELNKDFYIHKRNVFEIIRRCDKRRVYMDMFHDLKEMCEYKSVAIETFWINTLKPFMVVNEKLPIYNCPNETFSLYRILAVIRCAYEARYPDCKFEYPKPERIQDILYDFKYCSMTREAMIAYVETFADTYGVGISRIFEENKNSG